MTPLRISTGTSSAFRARASQLLFCMAAIAAPACLTLLIVAAIIVGENS